MAKSLVTFVALLAVVTAYPRNYTSNMAVMEKRLILKGKVEGLLLKGVGDTERDSRKLRDSLNDFSLYTQDAVYFYHKAATSLKDPELQEIVIGLAELTQKLAYRIDKNLNDNRAKLLNTTETVLETYYNLIPFMTKLEDEFLFREEKHQVWPEARSLVRRGYDISYYKFVLLRAVLRYLKAEPKDVQTVADTASKNISATLKTIAPKDLKVRGELEVYVQDVGFFADRLFYKTRRWLVHGNTNSITGILDSAFSKLQNEVDSLRKASHEDLGIEELATALERFVETSASELKKLTDACGGAAESERGVCNEFLVEWLSILRFLETELNLMF